MKRIVILVLTLACAISCHQEGKNILVLTEKGGIHEPFVEAGLQWLDSLAKEKSYSLTVINDTEPMNATSLKGYDLIIQLNYPPYMWTDEAAASFIDYIEDGWGSWIGFHHASLLGEFDGYPMWEWASEFLGDIVYENYIPELSDGEVRVEALDHPVMKGVPASFTLPDDEWYIYNRSPRNKVTVLANVNEDSYTTDTQVKMGDHPVIWTNPKVRARNIYFQMGHSPKLFHNPNFTRMLENAIVWSMED